MSSSIQLVSVGEGGRIAAQGAEAEDRLVPALVGKPVVGEGVVVGEGRVVKDHGEGGLKAAEAGCGRKPQDPLYCMTLLTLVINALRIQAKGCRRKQSQTHR